MTHVLQKVGKTAPLKKNMLIYCVVIELSFINYRIKPVEIFSLPFNILHDYANSAKVKYSFINQLITLTFYTLILL